MTKFDTMTDKLKHCEPPIEKMNPAEARLERAWTAKVVRMVVAGASIDVRLIDAGIVGVLRSIEALL